MVFKLCVVVINFPENTMTVYGDLARVMLAVEVIFASKIIKVLNSWHEFIQAVIIEGANAGCAHDLATLEGLAEMVIEFAACEGFGIELFLAHYIWD